MCWRKGCLDIEDRRTVYYFDRLDVNGLFFYFFFFQAEDGIRDGRVTWSSDVCSSDLSSGVNWTYRPFANSYPLIISSFSTFSPSFEQTYCCFRRAPSFLCSQLNEIAADDSPAENILIGTETSPKEIVAEPMECAGIGPADRERVTARA